MSLSTLRLLVVDDDEILVRSMRRLLRIADVGDAQFAAGSDEALALVASERFDVALVDVRLGGMSGLSLVDALRAIQPGLATILISGGARPHRADSMFLQKPFTVAQLVDAIVSVTSDRVQVAG
jgi:two-component system, NtrC family, response regulator AlgB